MTAKTNDELRLEFAKIYGRMPSVCELLQFKKNRPVKFFEPRKPPRRRSRVALPPPQLAGNLPDDVPHKRELVLNLAQEQQTAPQDKPDGVESSKQEDKEEEERETSAR